MKAWVWRVLVACSLGGCSMQTAAAGGTCTRSTQCAAGLACVKGQCSSNLASIARQSQVPMLMSNDAAAAGNDAGSGH
jgi:hypothetical protein